MSSFLIHPIVRTPRCLTARKQRERYEMNRDCSQTTCSTITEEMTTRARMRHVYTYKLEFKHISAPNPLDLLLCGRFTPGDPKRQAESELLPITLDRKTS